MLGGIVLGGLGLTGQGREAGDAPQLEFAGGGAERVAHRTGGVCGAAGVSGVQGLEDRSAIACAHGFQKVVTRPALATVTKFPLGNSGIRLRSVLMSR